MTETGTCYMSIILQKIFYKSKKKIAPTMHVKYKAPCLLCCCCSIGTDVIIIIVIVIVIKATTNYNYY